MINPVEVPGAETVMSFIGSLYNLLAAFEEVGDTKVKVYHILAARGTPIFTLKTFSASKVTVMVAPPTASTGTEDMVAANPPSYLSIVPVLATSF